MSKVSKEFQIKGNILEVYCQDYQAEWVKRNIAAMVFILGSVCLTIATGLPGGLAWPAVAVGAVAGFFEFTRNNGREMWPRTSNIVMWIVAGMLLGIASGHKAAFMGVALIVLSLYTAARRAGVLAMERDEAKKLISPEEYEEAKAVEDLAGEHAGYREGS